MNKESCPIFRNRLPLLGTLLGAAAGYLYYHYIGCASGSCPIASSPYWSVALGGIIGWLVFDLFRSGKKSSKDQKVYEGQIKKYKKR